MLPIRSVIHADRKTLQQQKYNNTTAEKTGKFHVMEPTVYVDRNSSL